MYSYKNIANTVTELIEFLGLQKVVLLGHSMGGTIVLYNQELINNEKIIGYSEPFLDNEIFIAFSKMIRHRECGLPAQLLNKIKTSCLLIWGEHDKSVPLHIRNRLKNDLINSQLIVLSETGHAIQEERPYELLQHIKNFLDTDHLQSS